MYFVKLKNLLVNVLLLIFSIFFILLIFNLLILNFPSQKFYPRSLANSLPNALVTFYPDTYTKNNLENYVAILGDSYSQGNGDAYLNGTYDYSIGHHLYKNNEKNYLIFGRAGFGSISAVSNLIKIKKINDSSFFLRKLNKPESIIFFFYEGNDLEDNFFEFSSLSHQSENIDDFVIRRIQENTSINFKDKLISELPLISIINDLYFHTKILFSKLITSNEESGKVSLILNRLKKLFGFTIVIETGEKKDIKYNNSIKNNNSYNNIQALHSAATALSKEEILVSLQIFFKSIKFLMYCSDNKPISIVYLPSPITCYNWDEPIEYNIKNSKVIKTVSNDENDKNSRYIRSKIKEFSMKNNIKFIDIAQIIKEKKINKILHGPLDWTHFNYDGYKIVSDYIVKNNVN